MSSKQFIAGSVEPIDLVKYAGASGDFNPVHTVLEEARKSGHTGLIAHGMYIMGLATKALETWYPGQELVTFQVRFQSPAYTGDELTVTETMAILTESGKLQGTIEVTDSHQQVKLKGNFLLKARKEHD